MIPVRVGAHDRADPCVAHRCQDRLDMLINRRPGVDHGPIRLVADNIGLGPGIGIGAGVAGQHARHQRFHLLAQAGGIV